VSTRPLVETNGSNAYVAETGASRPPRFASAAVAARSSSGARSPKRFGSVSVSSQPSREGTPSDETRPLDANAEALAYAAAEKAEKAAGLSTLDLETALARALHAAKRRASEAETSARRFAGERDAAEARARAAEARLAVEAKARRAAERDAAASNARCAVFEARMEELRSGRGRRFGSVGGPGERFASVPAPPFPSAALEILFGPLGSAAATESRRERVRDAELRGDVVVRSARGERDAGNVAVDFFEIPPEFDDSPTAAAAGKAAEERDARGETSGKGARDGNARGWAPSAP
jgi:hypothetical protein